MCGECLSTWWRWRLVFLLFLLFFFFLFLLPLNSIVLFLFLPLSDWFFFYLPIIIHWVSISRKTKSRTILHNIKSESNDKSFLYPRESYSKPIHISLKSKKSNRTQTGKKSEKKPRQIKKTRVKTEQKQFELVFVLKQPNWTETGRFEPVSVFLKKKFGLVIFFFIKTKLNKKWSSLIQTLTLITEKKNVERSYGKKKEFNGKKKSDTVNP